jgi:hypothetical protein
MIGAFGAIFFWRMKTAYRMQEGYARVLVLLPRLAPPGISVNYLRREKEA